MKREGMPTQRLDEKRVEERVREGERERERERKRERKSALTRERKREKKHFGSSFICFFLPWACPVQVGLSQERCLFRLKSSLWSSDLPLTFLVF